MKRTLLLLAGFLRFTGKAFSQDTNFFVFLCFGQSNNLLHDLNLKADDVPLIVGELVNADQKGACASMNRIIDDLPKTISTAHVVFSAGCTSRPDHLHFTPTGYRELGKRYAETMLPLLGYRMAEPR